MTILNLVSLKEAETGLSRLIDQVRQGEHVLLVEDGVEIARIVPPASGEPTADNGERKPKRQGGFWAGQIKEIDPDWWKPENDLTYLFECMQDEPENDKSSEPMSR